ncbi:hypothetical protein YC2023_099777 [Brassica napus]
MVQKATARSNSDRMRSDATRDCRGCHGRSQTVKAATPLRKAMEYETLSTMLLTEKPFKAPSTSSATFFNRHAHRRGRHRFATSTAISSFSTGQVIWWLGFRAKLSLLKSRFCGSGIHLWGVLTNQEMDLWSDLGHISFDKTTFRFIRHRYPSSGKFCFSCQLYN